MKHCLQMYKHITVYGMHAALFWKGIVVLEEYNLLFVQHPLDMSEIFDYILSLDSIEHMSFSEGRLFKPE